jgi:CrcB protein
MLINLLVIAGGGALGSIFRFLLSGWVEGFFEHRDFPFGIFSCNVLGSFIIGIIGGLVLKKSEFSELWRLFLVVGFCGGFTTFSSFSLDNISLLRSGTYGMAFTNIILSVVVCLVVTYIGIIIIPKN